MHRECRSVFPPAAHLAADADDLPGPGRKMRNAALGQLGCL
jgi:hypothetical protein